MNDGTPKRNPLAGIYGTVCVLLGLAQLLYFVFVLVGLIGFVLLRAVDETAHVAASVAPPGRADSQYLVQLGLGIAGASFSLAMVAIVAGCRSLYRRRIGAIGALSSATLSCGLAFLHFKSSLQHGGFVYIGIAVILLLLLLSDAFFRQPQALPESADS